MSKAIEDRILTDRVSALEARLARVEAAAAKEGERELEINPAVLYTLPEAAERLRCGLSTAYALARSGQLHCRSVGVGGKGYRILGVDLLGFLRGDGRAADDGLAAPRKWRR